MFYSGLIEKMSLSFTSSNSSFTECVRDYIPHHSFPSNSASAIPTCSINGTLSTEPSCNLSQHNELTSKGSYVFTSCIWTGCSAAKGGAIYATHSESTLTVTSCTFNSCESSDDLGGGIYTKDLNIIEITNSKFVSCKNTQQKGPDDGGGAAYLLNTKVSLSIHYSDFINCLTAADGGGLNLFNHSPTSLDSFESLRFIGCKSTPWGSGREGGAFQLNGNSFASQFINSLIVDCSANTAGGLWIAPRSLHSGATIRFCLFHGNDASTTTGKDIYLEHISTVPTLHSFTTSPGNTRVYPPNWNSVEQRDNWLPLTNTSNFFLGLSTHYHIHSSLRIDTRNESNLCRVYLKESYKLYS